MQQRQCTCYLSKSLDGDIMCFEKCKIFRKTGKHIQISWKAG